MMNSAPQNTAAFTQAELPLPVAKIEVPDHVQVVLAINIPLDIKFHLQDVGGPSAGTMFALGIVEQLTAESLTGGKSIAGTGTIDLSGNVGPISGITQKMQGARADGAEFFLAPARNCEEVQGHVPRGLTVAAVSNFDQVLSVTQKIRSGDIQDLPKCPLKPTEKDTDDAK